MIYAPTLPVEFAVGLLTAGVAYAYQQEDVGDSPCSRRSSA